MKSLPKFLKLKDTHPLMQRLLKVFDCFEQEQISILFTRHNIILSDWKENKEYIIQDLELGRIEDFPPSLEFKIIYDNPEYLEFVKKREEQRLEREQRENEEKQRLENERQKFEENKKKTEIELKEKELLKKLKEKYPDEA